MREEEGMRPESPGGMGSSSLDAGRSEVGWLIELRDENGSPSWMTLKPAEALWGLVWTKDSSEALRFARRVDAEDYYACHIDDAPDTFITEHRWG
jgi:hypothetical protein